MKFLRVSFVMLIVLSGIWVEVGSAQENKEAWTPDTKLRSVVRAALSLDPDDALTPLVLQGFTSLNG